MTDNRTLYADAVRAHREGRIPDAEKLYRSIIEIDSGHADALHMLGVIQAGRGSDEQAYRLFRRAASAAPQNAGFLNNLGVSARAVGKPEEAIEAFRKALAQEPTLIDARCNLGNALLAQGEDNAAISEYRAVLENDSSHSGALNNLAIAYRAVGNLPGALSICRELSEQNPDDPSALASLGAILAETGDVDAAMDCYHKALAIDPDHLDALNNLGVALMETGQSANAEHCFQRVLMQDSRSVAALGNLGTVLRREGRVEDAAAAYRASLAIVPDDAIRIRLASLMPVVAKSDFDLDNFYSDIENNINNLIEDNIRIVDPVNTVGTTQFHLSYHDRSNKNLNEKIARLYLQACPSLKFTAPHCDDKAGRRGGRLRVGFVSMHFRDHAVGWCYQGIMRLMPKDTISVSAFTFGETEDPLWHAIASDVDYAAVLPGNLAAARSTLADARLDILVFTDIGMDPLTYFLAFSRLAPVQCVTNGHPDTTGIPTIDYFISSAPLEPEGAAAHYSEKLALLDDALVHYDRPVLPACIRPRIAFGLPDDATLYLCPQSLFKIHPRMDAALAGILNRDASAVIAIFEGAEPEWSRLLMARWKNVLGEKIARVQLIPRQSFDDFLNIVSLADVVLDTWPFGGGNTSYQGFALGKPIVTLPGRFARGRSTLALYDRMEIPDLIAGSWEEYVTLAVRLGVDPEWRRELSDRIRERAPVLFGDTRAVDAFARFLLSVGPQSEVRS